MKNIPRQLIKFSTLCAFLAPALGHAAEEKAAFTVNVQVGHCPEAEQECKLDTILKDRKVELTLKPEENAPADGPAGVGGSWEEKIKYLDQEATLRLAFAHYDPRAGQPGGRIWFLESALETEEGGKLRANDQSLRLKDMNALDSYTFGYSLAPKDNMQKATSVFVTLQRAK
jgi:hypothetical protein